MLPTGWKASRAVSFSTVHCARRVIVRDALCWKTSPGACEVEPPVSNSGPWSTTTMSLPAALGQVVGHAGAGDAGPDHDDAGGLGRRAHLAS